MNIPTIDSTPGQLGRPAGDGDAEEDVARAAVPAQEQGPGTLDQGAERELTRSHDGLERGRHRGRQTHVAARELYSPRAAAV